MQWYFAGPQLDAIWIDDFKFQFIQQPYGWPGEKITTDMPITTNLTGSPWGFGNEFYAREFWRFVMVQKVVLDLAETAVDYPPMQDPASFNLEAVKKRIATMIKNHAGQ